MVGGQALDLAAAGQTRDPRRRSARSIGARPARCSRPRCASARWSAALGRPLLRRLTTYGEQLGLCFQIADDIADAVRRRRRPHRSGARQGDVSGAARPRRRARVTPSARATPRSRPWRRSARGPRRSGRSRRWWSRSSTSRSRWPRRRRHGGGGRPPRSPAGRPRAGAESRARAASDPGRRRAGRRPAGDEGRGRSWPADAPLRLRGSASDYVSRGGEKLAGALDAFAHRRRRHAWRSTSAPRPAASPTACCAAARAA